MAAQYQTTHITSCKVKKEDMSMHIDIMSDVFPCSFPLDAFKEKIIQKFGIANIKFSLGFKNFELTKENLPMFYDQFREMLCAKHQALTNILTGSSAELDQNVLHIKLRFGGEKTACGTAY